jgi:protein-tyrosine phosphatase
LKSILFVCLGNICRSPLAEGIAKEIFKQKGLNVKVDSAGIGSWHIGKPPCTNSIQVAKLHNIDISNLKARRVHPQDKELFDYIIAMDESNRQELLERFNIASSYKIGDFGLDSQDIPDPYFYKDFEGFEKVYSMLDKGIRNFIDKKY